MKKLILSLFLIVVFSGCVQQNKPMTCTEEAKICPDGSAVERVPPDCEFAPCPTTVNCSAYSGEEIQYCPSPCVVCPPCIECSSISCQTEEFCKSIGFDRNWYNKTVIHAGSLPG